MFIFIFFQQQGQFKGKVFEVSHKLRAMVFGQDRYKRRYWALPFAGGIYIEGLESGEVEEEENQESAETEKQNLDSELVKCEKEEEEVKKENDVIKENVSEENVSKEEVKKEQAIKDEKVKCEENEEVKPEPDVKWEVEPVKNEPLNLSKSQGSTISSDSLKTNGDVTMKDVEEERDSKTQNGEAHAFKEPDGCTNLFLQKPGSTKLTDFMSKADGVKSPEVTSPFMNNTHDKSSSFRLNNSASTASPGSSFMSIDNILSKDNSCSSPGFFNNSYLPHSLYPVGPLSAKQMLKNLSRRSSLENSWFSVLPRMPCDETSLTRSHSPTKPSPKESSKLSPPPVGYSPFQLHSPTFASFQMGQIRGPPNDFSSVGQFPSPNQISQFNSFRKPVMPPVSSSTPCTGTPSAVDSIECLQFPEPQPIPLGKYTVSFFAW